MLAKDFIKAWKDGRTLVNDIMNGDITRTAAGTQWQMHMNAEIIVFFDDIHDALQEVVALVEGDKVTPLCTHNWRVRE